MCTYNFDILLVGLRGTKFDYVSLWNEMFRPYLRAWKEIFKEKQISNSFLLFFDSWNSKGSVITTWRYFIWWEGVFILIVFFQESVWVFPYKMISRKSIKGRRDYDTILKVIWWQINNLFICITTNIIRYPLLLCVLFIQCQGLHYTFVLQCK